MRKLRGRPIKPVAAGEKRVQVTALIRGSLKRRIMHEAKQNGRTLSAEVENWLERLEAYESLTKLAATLAKLKPPSFWAEFEEAMANFEGRGEGVKLLIGGKPFPGKPEEEGSES